MESAGQKSNRPLRIKNAQYDMGSYVMPVQINELYIYPSNVSIYIFDMQTCLKNHTHK